jgi:hypothetical protein
MPAPLGLVDGAYQATISGFDPYTVFLAGGRMV